MQKLSEPTSTIIFRSLVRSKPTAMKAANPKPSADAPSRSYASFTKLKITAEKLVKEQASVKTDLEMADDLRRTTEQVNPFDGKLQEAVNENAKHEVKQSEDSKLWQGLDSEISSAKTLWDQLTKQGVILQGAIQKLLEYFTIAKNHKQELREKILKLESDNLDLQGQGPSIKADKSNNFESLQGERTKRDQKVDILENQINQLRSLLNEKEQLYSCTPEREKTLEDQKLQVKPSLAGEAKKQNDLMLEVKKVELSKHLKELSVKNDQVINEICKKYELEKTEITNVEKEKAEKEREFESKCNEKITDFESYLVHLKAEHGTMVERIQQDNEHKESTLWSYHKEELQRIQSHAENELRKEQLTSLMKMRYPYERKEHELLINSVRSKHSTVAKDSGEKGKNPSNNQRYPGNTATVLLDSDRREASLRSFKRGIRKARAWCRSTSKPVDLSDHFGPGAEVFTTPANGTFHLTFEYNKRRLTLFIYGRDLYVMGWHSEKNGTFEIVKNFIPDSSCKFLDVGVNYRDLCPEGRVAKVRVGLEALIESFEVLDKCDGVITTDLAQKIAMFCVGTSEPIRLQDVFEGYADSFISCFPYLAPDAYFWIRKYGYYSRQYLTYLHKILSGDPPPKIDIRPGGNVTSIQELRHRIRVPLRDSLSEGKFAHEDPETPVWSPPYADGEDWDDTLLDEDDETYWPVDEEMEQEDEESTEEENENDKGENTTVRSSIFRFSTPAASCSVDLLGRQGLFGAINTVRVNKTHCQPFLTASGRKANEVKSSFPWRSQSFAWRKLQVFMKFLNKFK